MCSIRFPEVLFTGDRGRASGWYLLVHDLSPIHNLQGDIARQWRVLGFRFAIEVIANANTPYELAFYELSSTRGFRLGDDGRSNAVSFPMNQFYARHYGSRLVMKVF